MRNYFLRSVVMAGVGAGTLLAIATPAEARWHGGHHHHHHGGGASVFFSTDLSPRYAPAPVYYAPPPQPVYYAPAAPVYAPPPPVQAYQPAPVYSTGRCVGAPVAGTFAGGALGGVIGNQFGSGSGNAAATIGGILLGAALGNSADPFDERCATMAMETMNPNMPYQWQGYGDSNYTVVPGNVQQDNGRYCREYQVKVNVAGRLQDGYGRACRQPDGSWQAGNI